MTIKECYEKMGANYQEVISRLMTDARVEKYVLKFADGNYYTLIEETLAEEKWEDAFRNVHNLKGVALNLSLTNVHKTSDILCEALRGGKPDIDITPLLADVKKAYDEAIAAIKLL
ncbi:MAG: Hpt domain-containing protein [Lachnospiraceae bacterium]|nr:Hpt domain-containing protein [Lachnospiraceae bacterium]MDE6698806.1 Hpt domain-containing protein [Lachnospiraceae bacterium]